MGKTFALFKRMSPYLAEKARNLIDVMLLSTEEVGWDSQQQSIANGRVYHDPYEHLCASETALNRFT